MEISVTRRTAKNSFWVLLGRSCGKLLEFITFVYLARVLTASGFGLFSFAQAILMYLLLFVDSGLSILGIREIAQNRKKLGKIGANIFALRLILAAILFFISIIIVIVVPAPLPVKYLLALTFLMVFPRALNSEWVYQGLEKMELMSVSRVLEQAIFFVLVVLTIKNLNDILAIPVAQLIGGALTSLIFFFLLIKYFMPLSFKNVDFSNWTNLFFLSVPLGVSSIFIQIYINLDVIMLGFMKNTEVVGWYNAAYKLFFAFLGIIGVFATAVFPIVCKKFAEGEEQARTFLEKYLRLMNLWSFPAALLAILCADPAIRLIFGPNYLPGSMAFKILIVTIMIVSVSGVYGGLVLLPVGRNKEYMYGVGLGAAANIVLNFILIPPFSLVGAAVATLITEMIVAFAFIYYTQRVIKIPWWEYVVKPLLAGAVAFLITYLASGWIRIGDMPFILISAVLFLLIYLLIIGLAGETRFLLGFAKEIIGDNDAK